MDKTISLSVWDTLEVPEELYELLLEQFLKKAEQMGYDPNDIVIDDWTIKAVINDTEFEKS